MNHAATDNVIRYHAGCYARPVSAAVMSELNVRGKVKTLILILLGGLVLCGCTPKDQYTKTKAFLLHRKFPAGTEILKFGGAEGPYTEIMGAIGGQNGELNVTWKSPSGDIRVDQAKEDGYYFQIEGYKNKDQAVFWILLRIKNPDKNEPNHALQTAVVMSDLTCSGK